MGYYLIFSILTDVIIAFGIASRRLSPMIVAT